MRRDLIAKQVGDPGSIRKPFKDGFNRSFFSQSIRVMTKGQGSKSAPVIAPIDHKDGMNRIEASARSAFETTRRMFVRRIERSLLFHLHQRQGKKHRAHDPSRKGKRRKSAGMIASRQLTSDDVTTAHGVG